MHQLLSVHDGTDVYTTQYPFVSVGSTSGIGTFGSEFSGSNLILKFYPDAFFNSSDIQVSALNLCIYNDNDVLNTINTPDLSYGNVVESVDLYGYNAPFGSRVEKTEFTLTNNKTPIFAKSRVFRE